MYTLYLIETDSYYFVSYSALNKTQTLIHFTDSEDNNFKLLRLVAATGVILSHSILLSGSLSNSSAWALGYISVNSFFFISGFLVFASLIHRNNLKHYVQARALRIFPGLIACVTLCTLMIGLGSPEVDLTEYFSSSQTFGFWLKNSLLIVGEVQTTLPTTVFQNNPLPDEVNTPLWTLQYELLMYAILAFLFFIVTRLHKNTETHWRYLIGCLTIVSMILFLVNVIMYQPLSGFTANLMRFSAMFFFGASCYLFRRKIPLGLPIVCAVFLLLVLSFTSRVLFTSVFYLALGYLLLCAAYLPTGRIRKFNRCGDYSYGLYIYAFPIQQYYIYLYPSIEPIILFFASMLTTLPLAALSWHFIERPALSIKPPKNPMAETTIPEQQ